MTTIQLKKKIDSHIRNMDARRLEALLKLVEIMDNEQEEDDFELSEKDLQIIDQRMEELDSGKVKGIDAYEAIEAGLALLKKSAAKK